MKIDCFNNQGTEIYYDENLKSIVATYKGMIKYDDWVEHLEHAIKLIKKHNIQKWLTDTRETKVIPPANQKYFEEIFIPSTHQTSMKYIATVLAKDVFSKFGVNQMMTKYKSQKGKSAAINKYFETVEQAKEWLESQ